MEPWQFATRQLKRYQWIRLFAFLSLIIFGLVVLLAVENMLLSFILAFVISYLFEPIIHFLERTGVTRFLAICFTFILSGLLLVGGATALRPFLEAQVNSFRSELPRYINGTTELLEKLEHRVEGIIGSNYPIELGERVGSVLLGWTNSLFEDLPKLLSDSLTTLLLAPFFAFFLLKDGRTISRNLFNMVPNNFFELTLNLYHQINEQIGHFIRARLLEGAIVGFVVFIGLQIIDFPYATLLAIFAALTNLIPYIGPIIGGIPALAIALISNAGPVALLMVVLVYSIAQLIDIVFIIPLVVAKIVDLHPVTVVISIIIGAQLMGVLGMIISIPVASTIKLTLISIYRHTLDFHN